MKRKQGHLHIFGQQCAVCLKNNPQAHQTKKRATYRERKLKRGY